MLILINEDVYYLGERLIKNVLLLIQMTARSTMKVNPSVQKGLMNNIFSNMIFVHLGQFLSVIKT